MIKIDFHAGTHGHFLEYITNVYIMQTAPSNTSIFRPPTMSAHDPDINYLSNRQIICGHFSDPEFYKGEPFDKNDQIIRIVFDTDDDIFLVALTNLICKAGDHGFNKQLLAIPDHVRNNPVAHRNDWYSKFEERDLYSPHYKKFIPVPNKIFEFSLNSFFCFTAFCTELNKLAKFLNQTFYPDSSLYTLWKEFINVNQGWQSYVKCRQIIEDIFSNKFINIDCSIIEEGWLNYRLTRICQIYSGPLFDNPVYPTNTQVIYNILQEHLDSK
jgi:hypothetical protein